MMALAIIAYCCAQSRQLRPGFSHKARFGRAHSGGRRVVFLTIARHIAQLMSIAGVVIVVGRGFVAVVPAAESTAPTFDREVAPILLKNCANCHRPGQIAEAVSLVSYDTARPWAKSIKAKVLRREMPPWPADPNESVKFRNDARLRQQDIDTLVAWVNAGAPRGNDADLPPVPEFEQG